MRWSLKLSEFNINFDEESIEGISARGFHNISDISPEEKPIKGQFMTMVHLILREATQE